MGIHLSIIKDLAADFDGDTLNILAIINKEFEKFAMISFNPRNNFQISKNDGMMNKSVNHQRDIIINSNSLMQLSRSHYSESHIKYIKQLQSMEN